MHEIGTEAHCICVYSVTPNGDALCISGITVDFWCVSEIDGQHTPPKKTTLKNDEI